MTGRGVWKLLAALALLGAVVALVGCGESSSQSAEIVVRTTLVEGSAAEPKVPRPSGPEPKQLVVRDLRPGWGVAAREGDLLTTKLVAISYNGDPFESSWEPGSRPFSFHLGAEEASPGWEKGLRGMRVGGRRELIVPPDLASRFGPLESGEALIYVVELIGVTPPELDDRREPTVAIPPGAPPEKLEFRDVIRGKGPPVRSGDLVTMQYISRRYTGEPFSNSWDDPRPFRIHLGADTFKSIPGWEEGLPGMRVGGRREIIVPPEWIVQGAPPPDSTPSETLVYLVDMYGTTEAGAFRQAPPGR
jgi:peptidylprolyl isomerase